MQGSLYMHLCTVKSSAYHSMEKPIFWWPIGDWLTNGNAQADARRLRIGMYVHILEMYHKPKLRALKLALIRHDAHMQRHMYDIWISTFCFK